MIHPEQAAIMLPVLHAILEGETVEIEHPQPARKVRCADFLAGDIVETSPYRNDFIYVTYLQGTMMKHDDWCGDPGTRTIGNELLKADREKDVIGHIIVADSGGGTAESVAEISRAIKGCTKPVVAFVDGIAASACIYAISYCKEIIAHETMDQIGCIGTCINVSGWPKFRRSADGYVNARIYADPSSEKNADYEAALEGDFKLIRENVLNPLAEQFMNDMKANRPNATDDQLTGRTYFARDVVGSLIDSIGTFDDAVDAVIRLAAPKDEENNSTSTNMKESKYPHMEAIPSLNELAYDNDGSTHLQPDQLADIEAALADRETAEEKQKTIDDLQSQIDQKDADIKAKDARIKELQKSLDAAIEKANEEKPAGIQIDHDPAGDSKQDIKPAETFEEALKVCQEFMKK